MYDGTLVKPSSYLNADRLLPWDAYTKFSKPTYQKMISEPYHVVGTHVFDNSLPTKNNILLKDLYQEYRFAKHWFAELDEEQLTKAYVEAFILINCELFDENIYPDISIDPYGEITFSHRSLAGYVDIGVRGVCELSYHVRNDICPDQTTFEDYNWEDYQIPSKLIKALKILRQNLNDLREKG